MQPIEIWKDIPEYKGIYQVSNLGRVKSLPKKWFTGIGNIEISHNGLILKPHFCGPNKDYLFVNLRKNKQSKPCKIHHKHQIPNNKLRRFLTSSFFMM